MSYYISGSVSWSKTCHTIEVEVCVTGKWVHASAYEMRESVLCVFVSVLVVCAYLCIHVCVCVCVSSTLRCHRFVCQTQESHIAPNSTPVPSHTFSSALPSHAQSPSLDLPLPCAQHQQTHILAMHLYCIIIRISCVIYHILRL